LPVRRELLGQLGLDLARRAEQLVPVLAVGPEGIGGVHLLVSNVLGGSVALSARSQDPTTNSFLDPNGGLPAASRFLRVC
jgi:hypothetical protein